MLGQSKVMPTRVKLCLQKLCKVEQVGRTIRVGMFKCTYTCCFIRDTIHHEYPPSAMENWSFVYILKSVVEYRRTGTYEYEIMERRKRTSHF